LTIPEMTAQEFLARRAAGKPMTLLDVREDWEIKVSPVPAQHHHIPMGQIADRIAELDPQVETVVICRSGGRSLQVANYLGSRGFSSVHNLAGGILAWSREVDPSIPQY
jgi:rhodanese-related sulfurtransferase